MSRMRPRMDVSKRCGYVLDAAVPDIFRKVNGDPKAAVVTTPHALLCLFASHRFNAVRTRKRFAF